MENTQSPNTQQPQSIKDLPDPTPQVALNTFVGFVRSSRLSYDEHVYFDKCTVALQGVINSTLNPPIIPPFPKMEV